MAMQTRKKLTRITITLPILDKQQIGTLAIENRRSVSAEIGLAIEKHLRENGRRS